MRQTLQISSLALSFLSFFAMASPPFVISKGGTYSGSWVQTDTTQPAVIINTTEPVTLEHCLIKGAAVGTALIAGKNNVNLNVFNCYVFGNPDPIVPNRIGVARGRFISLVNVKRLDVEHNYLEHTGGIDVYGSGALNQNSIIKISFNSVKDIDGRPYPYSPSTVCEESTRTPPHKYCHRSFVHLLNLLNDPSIWVTWNQVINEPNESATEDNIILLNSSGTAANPITIGSNYIQGVYPANPESDENFTGSGINAGDGFASDPQHASGFVNVYNNQIVNTDNSGIFIATGHDIVLNNNRVVSSGLIPITGQKFARRYKVGITIFNYYPAGAPMYNDYASNNVVGVNAIHGYSPFALFRNDYSFPSPFCSGDAQNPLCLNDLPLNNNQEIVTPEDEKLEFVLWQKKLADKHYIVGPLDSMP